MDDEITKALGDALTPIVARLVELQASVNTLISMETQRLIDAGTSEEAATRSLLDLQEKHRVLAGCSAK